MLIIARVALLVALTALARTGGIRELRDQVQTLNSTTDAIRDRTVIRMVRYRDSDLVEVDGVQLADRPPIDEDIPAVVDLEVRDLRHRSLEAKQVDAVENLDVEVAQ